MGQVERVEVAPGLIRVTDKSGEGNRYYLWKRKQYPSVTTIISNSVPKPFLQRWAAKEAALAALHNIDALAELAGERIEWAEDRRPITPAARAAYDLMAGASERSREQSADLGSRIHDIAEDYALGIDMPADPDDEIGPFLATVRRWFDDFQPDVVAAEATVISETYGYAGTMDLAARLVAIGGRRLLLDYKSGKSVSSDVALQLAGLRHADFMVLPDGSTAPVPEVDGCAVVHVRPEGYRMYEVKADEETFLTFRYAQAMHGWVTEHSKAFKVAELKAKEVA